MHFWQYAGFWTVGCIVLGGLFAYYMHPLRELSPLTNNLTKWLLTLERETIILRLQIATLEKEVGLLRHRIETELSVALRNAPLTPEEK